jgi:hypothetical protein
MDYNKQENKHKLENERLDETKDKFQKQVEKEKRDTCGPSCATHISRKS